VAEHPAGFEISIVPVSAKVYVGLARVVRASSSHGCLRQYKLFGSTPKPSTKFFPVQQNAKDVNTNFSRGCMITSDRWACDVTVT